MSINLVISSLVNGLRLGSVYAIVAVGYSMVYGILHLINFAHGDIMTIGVYMMLLMMNSMGLPLWLVIPLSVCISVIVGVLIERLAYRPLRSATEEATLISSLAVSTLLQNLLQMVFSPQKQAFHLPDFFRQRHDIFGVRLSTMNLITFAALIVIVVALTFAVNKTKIGTAMRACSENLDAARLMGIGPNKVIVVAFVIGSGLAALAGLMLAGEYGSVTPLMGFDYGLKAFCAAVVGGIGSLYGAVLGGLVIGLAEMLFAGLVPNGAAWQGAFVFVVLILALLVRPNGLLGQKEGGRS